MRRIPGYQLLFWAPSFWKGAAGAPPAIEQSRGLMGALR
jgi:hypothetical protein